MNKRVPIRAWDHINQVMVYDFTSLSKDKIRTDEGVYSWHLGVTERNQLITYIGFRKHKTHFIEKIENMDMMLSMDTRDDDQKRIYQNDIVLMDLDWVGGRKGKEYFPVEYIDSTFYIHAWSGVDIEEGLKSGQIKSIKVVGNTYENKDLLALNT